MACRERRPAATLRAARSAQYAYLPRVAASCGAEADDLARRLAALPARGRCAHLAAEAAADSAAVPHAVDRLRPPGPRRSALGMPLPIAAAHFDYAAVQARLPMPAEDLDSYRWRDRLPINHVLHADALKLTRLRRNDVARLATETVTESRPIGGPSSNAYDEWESASFAAACPACPPAVAWRLACADYHDTLFTLSQRPHAGTGPLSVLAADDDNDMWDSLGENPGLPPRLIKMFVSGNAASRELAAYQHHCSRGWFEQFASDASPEVRAAVAANPFCPDDLVERLAGDHEPLVAGNAGRNRGSDRRAASNGRDSVRRAAAAG